MLVWQLNPIPSCSVPHGMVWFFVADTTPCTSGWTQWSIHSHSIVMQQALMVSQLGKIKGPAINPMLARCCLTLLTLCNMSREVQQWWMHWMVLWLLYRVLLWAVYESHCVHVAQPHVHRNHWESSCCFCCWWWWWWCSCHNVHSIARQQGDKHMWVIN